jgi:hypothetical protein
MGVEYQEWLPQFFGLPVLDASEVVRNFITICLFELEGRRRLEASSLIAWI